MDFTSTTRALQSLQRRQPPLSDHVVATAQLLLLNDNNNNNNNNNSTTDPFVRLIEQLVWHNDNRWEALAVGVLVATQALEESSSSTSVYMEGPRVPSIMIPTTSTTTTAATATRVSSQQALQLCQLLHAMALKHMEHSEPRVRSLVAKAVGAYIKVSLQLDDHDDDDDTGTRMRNEIVSKLLESIQTHITMGRDAAAAAAAGTSHSKSSTGALDDTTGWGALETNWHGLAALVHGLDFHYLQQFGLSSRYHLLYNIEHSAVQHVNRHVRAAAMNVLEQFITAAASSDSTQHYLTDSDSELRMTTVTVLTAGLADNWSQVRMAASVLCRVLLTTLQSLSVDLKPLWPALLPRMCLNRFYYAQGVQFYSHETWKLVMGSSGLDTVASHVPAMVRYYVQMCDADNHAVREAACQGMGELATRIAASPHPDRLLPHITVMLHTLIMCFHDELWPVRDEACVACGLICKAYPDKCHPELQTLWERWTGQLTDQIWSLRQNAAVALGYALEAYGPEVLIQIRALIAELVPSAKDQPAMTQAEFKAHQNDAAARMESQLDSSESLSPQRHQSGGFGCTLCAINRPKAPWEATDGCIYLIREVVIHCAPPDSRTPMTDNELIPLMRELADVCRVQHFPQGNDLRTTLWRQLPVMAQALGKDRFKRRYVEIFLDLLFMNLEARTTASQLSIHAAGQCAVELAQFIGVPMFRGRLEDYQKDIFDQVMRERQLLPKGPADAPAAFSPFIGPPGLLDSVDGHFKTALSG